MKTFKFYGAVNNQYKLDDVVWEAFEDPDDGYRSYLDSVQKVDSNEIFYPIQLDEVIVRKIETGIFYGYEIVGVETNHTWLTFGTDSEYDAWYPCFVFRYTPMLAEEYEEKNEWEDFIK